MLINSFKSDTVKNIKKIIKKILSSTNINQNYSMLKFNNFVLRNFWMALNDAHLSSFYPSISVKLFNVVIFEPMGCFDRWKVCQVCQTPGWSKSYLNWRKQSKERISDYTKMVGHGYFLIHRDFRYWDVFWTLPKSSIIDIWQGSKYEVVIDVLFDLKSDTSRLHRELNDTPIYIDANSHHSSNVNHQTT